MTMPEKQTGLQPSIAKTRFRHIVLVALAGLLSFAVSMFSHDAAAQDVRITGYIVAELRDDHRLGNVLTVEAPENRTKRSPFYSAIVEEFIDAGYVLSEDAPLRLKYAYKKGPAKKTSESNYRLRASGGQRSDQEVGVQMKVAPGKKSKATMDPPARREYSLEFNLETIGGETLWRAEISLASPLDDEVEIAHVFASYFVTMFGKETHGERFDK
jgi:hypothetical protein